MWTNRRILLYCVANPVSRVSPVEAVTPFPIQEPSLAAYLIADSCFIARTLNGFVLYDAVWGLLICGYLTNAYPSTRLYFSFTRHPILVFQK